MESTGNYACSNKQAFYINGFPLGCHVHLVVITVCSEIRAASWKEYPNKIHVMKNIYKCKKEYSPFGGSMW
jgi:hypothetical protein